MLSVYISMIWIAASLLASALNPSIDAFRNVVYISLMALFASFMLHIQRSRQAIRIARYSGLSFCNTAECIVGRNGFAFLLIIGLAIAASCFNSGALLPVFVCYCFIHMICFGALALHYRHSPTDPLQPRPAPVHQAPTEAVLCLFGIRRAYSCLRSRNHRIHLRESCPIRGTSGIWCNGPVSVPFRPS